MAEVLRNLQFAILFVLCLCISLSLHPAAASAGENPLEFLRVLRETGYGDMAVEYLRILEKRDDAPKEVREVFDLEMSKSLRAAADDAYDAREYERLTAEAQKHLAKFIGEKPEHPAVASALISWGEFLGQQALGRLGAAKAAAGKDQTQADKLRADARDDLEQAREKFEQARERLEKQLAALPPPPKLAMQHAPRGKTAEQRAEIENDLLETRFQSAMADYYLAQTYPDPKTTERTEALRRAAKGFDAIFQEDRKSGAALTLTGLRAHLWHGKTAEESGDLRLATDIYDEVLVNAAEPNERRPATGLEPLFAQVEYFRFLILAKQKPDQFLAEATDWLEQNQRRLRATEGYQGVALETAKAIYEKAQKAAGPEKSKGFSVALRILTDTTKVRGPYQQDAILLRRELLQASGKSDLEIGTFEEAVALADAAAADADWGQAKQLYDKALELAKQAKLKDERRLAAVGEARLGVELMLARELFHKGKLDRCIEAAERLIHADPEKKAVRKESEAAAQASALAVAAALNLYVNSSGEEKQQALERLARLAEIAESNWPGRPEADDARMARGQAKLVVNQVQEAIDIFERVNPKSARYPQAMYYAGQNYARLYLTEKNLPDISRDAAQAAAWRDRAVERLRAGLDALAGQLSPDRTLPDYYLESQLLLAEIQADAGRREEAAALYQPLIEAVKADAPKQFDQTTLRIFLGAVRAYAALGQFERAGAAADALVELGPDALQVNDALVRFAALLDLERKKAAAAVTELEAAADQTDLDAAKQRLADVKALLGNILGKLARRKEVSVAGMVFVADGLNSIGLSAEASRQYQQIVDRAQSDPAFAQAAAKAMTRVRAQLIGLLRQEGKFAEALEQVEQLIKDNPRALEPLMEKGYILEGWAEREPARFADAVAHWAGLRNRLQPMRKKPPEYYDVMYNVAACLVREAEHSEDKAIVADRAKKAEQVLKAALVLSPKLNGPDAVAKYKVLLNKAITLQGRKPEK